MAARIDLDLLEQIHDVTLGKARWEDVLGRLRAEFAAEIGRVIGRPAGPVNDAAG